VMSVGVVDDGTFQKKAVAIDRESGRNVITKEDISGSEIKGANTATTVRCLESKEREDGAEKNNAKGGVSAVDSGPIEKVKLGSDINQPHICKGVEMGSFNLGQNKGSEIQKTNTNRKPKGKINSPNSALKQTKEQQIKSEAQHSKGSGSKENEDTSVQNSKGSWRRLTRESSTTVAMDEESEVEGPKRKMMVPVDQNLTQRKKVKTDFDEVSLGMVFKQVLGSAEVAMQPRREQ